MPCRRGNSSFQSQNPAGSTPPATLRSWKPGDRVTLRHSAGPKKVKEVLERLKVSGSQRALWPVLDWQGIILWMQGVQLEFHPGIEVITTRLISEQ